jgi:hypothetical protein
MVKFTSKWWIVAFTVLHFLLERLLFLFAFAAGMDRFDNGRDLTVTEEALDGLVNVLEFPVTTIISALLPLDSLPGVSGYMIFGLNSLFWGIISWVVLRKSFGTATASG